MAHVVSLKNKITTVGRAALAGFIVILALYMGVFLVCMSGSLFSPLTITL